MSDLMVVLPAGLVSGEASLDATTLRWLDGDRQGQGDLQALAEVAGERECELVLSAADALVSSVTLARKQARHIQRVVPFLLEDQLTVPVDTQWFAWGDRDGERYSVVSVDRAGLESVLGKMRDAGLYVSGAFIDGQLLAGQAPCQVADEDRVLLVPAADRVLAVPANMVADTLVALALDEAQIPPLETALLPALQGARASGSGVQLLHGAMAPRRRKQQRKDPVVSSAWRPVLTFSGVALALLWVLMLGQAWQYDRAADDARSQAEALYESLFPGDRAVRLEAQFRQRLGQSGAGGAGGDAFLALLEAAGESVAQWRSKGIEPRRLQFDERQGALELELNAPDYETLETLQASLKERGLEAEIANFRNQGKKVTARMRVTS